MTEPTISRIEHEFSTGWCENNPTIAAEWIARDLTNLMDRGMKISFDFSRRGFFTITGEETGDMTEIEALERSLAAARRVALKRQIRVLMGADLDGKIGTMTEEQLQAVLKTLNGEA